MPGIGFILIYFFLLAISQAVLDKSVRDAFDGEIAEDVSTDWSEDLLDLRNSNVQGRTTVNDQECSCTYDFSNGFVKARLGHRLLKKGDSIRRGETVSFECRYVNTVLTWEIGLRFYGRANMTCNRCEKWQKQHLPTCRSAQQTDVVLGQEDDLAVLPSGVVQLQTGQSRRFSCNNIWRQPEWDYRRNNGVSVKTVEHSEDRETIFVSYLEITDAEEKHSGIYECYSRSPAGHRTLSTFLHIEVVRKSENDGTPFTSSETGASPTESTISTSREIPDDGNNRECSCEYNPGNRHHPVIASVGDKRLQKGDIVRHGDTVSFHCLRRERLSWVNGVQYQGSARMTCSKCEVWTDIELPTCQKWNITGHIAVSSREELSFLPGGILQMREGESHNITCFSNRFQPLWVHETKDNVVQRRENFRSLLEIKHAKSSNKGEYKCASSLGLVVGVLNLEVDSKSIDSTVVNCSKIPYTRGLRIYYSGFSVGSIARFRCSLKSRKLIGSSNTTCLKDGTWSNPAPVCNDSTVIHCSKFPLSPGLGVEYSGFIVGSTARFKCSPSTRKLSGSSDSTCLEDGTWSNPAPMCDDPKCSIEDLYKSLPSDVTLDTPNVDEFSPGSEMQLKCEESIMVGDSTALCGENGRWQVDNLTCVPGCRLDVNPSSKLRVEPRKNSYRIGEFVFLSCPLGYLLSNDVELLMCLSNRWSSFLPECVPETDKK